jgi:hypothetical protein
MQPYIIKSFKRVSDNAIFERQENGTNSGGYVYQTEVKRTRDFLCDGNFVINSVIKQIDPERPQDNIIFTIGDRLSNNISGLEQPSIIFIKIIQSEVILLCGANPHQTIRLINATKYVLPVEHPRITRRTTTISANNMTTRVETTTSPLDEIERTILERNPRAIRLERTLKRRRETLEEFLIKFFKEWNAEKTTIYVDDSTVQTTIGRRRSLGDIYMICKYYYPNCTLKEVLNFLYIQLPTVITSGFRTSYCHTINKRVWYYNATSSNTQADKTTNDEFGKPFRFYIENLTA